MATEPTDRTPISKRLVWIAVAGMGTFFIGDRAHLLSGPKGCGGGAAVAQEVGDGPRDGGELSAGPQASPWQPRDPADLSRTDAITLQETETLPASPAGVSWASSPSVASWGPRRLDVVVRGSNNDIYWNYIDYSTATPAWQTSWTALTLAAGLTPQGNPCIVSTGHSDGEGVLYAFVEDENGDLASAGYLSGSGWSELSDLTAVSGATMQTGPGCTSWGNNEIDVFAEGANGGVLHAMYDGGRWVGWQDAGPFNNVASDVEAAANQVNSINIVWTDSSGNANQAATTNRTAFSASTILDGYTNYHPVITSQARDLLDYYVRDAGNGEIQHRWWNWVDLSPGFENTGIIADDSPTVVSWGPGRVDMIYKLDGGLFHAVQVPSGVLTQHNDAQRTGRKVDEEILSADNVTTTNSSFGVQFDLGPLDGNEYGQPLYVPQVLMAIDGAYHNVVVVATGHNSVYAFDADTGAQLWYNPFVDAGYWSVPAPNPDLNDLGPNNGASRCGSNISPEIGITSTPVVDTTTTPPTVYVVLFTGHNAGGDQLSWDAGLGSNNPMCFGNASTVCNPDGVQCTTGLADATHQYAYDLVAINLADGGTSFRTPNPEPITGSVVGTADGGTTVTFSPNSQLQRPGLLLTNGTIFTAFGSIADQPPYHGWVFAHEASTFSELGVWCTTPDGGTIAGSLKPYSGGIWGAGGGLAADTSVPPNIYLATANGGFNNKSNDYGDSIVQLSTDAGSSTSTFFSVQSYFTPDNQCGFDAQDEDVGVAEPVIATFKSGTYVFTGSKEGTEFIARVDGGLGGYHSSSNSVTESFYAFATGQGYSEGSISLPGQALAWPEEDFVFIQGQNVQPASGVPQTTIQVYSEVDAGHLTCASGSAPLCHGSSEETVGTVDTIDADQNSECTLTNAGSGYVGSPDAVYDGGPWNNNDNGFWMSLASSETISLTHLLWAVQYRNANAARPLAGAVVHALNADWFPSYFDEYWNSDQNTAETLDIDGGFAAGRWIVPTIANGRLYVPVWEQADPTDTIPVPEGLRPYVRVYGLNGKCTTMDGGACCDDYDYCCTWTAPPCP
jgi:hypothetical protein